MTLRLKLPLIALLFLLIACEQKSAQVVSEVNGRSISTTDFVYAYETSPRSVLDGSKEMAYRQVLDRMIQRILLSQEAERTGLQQDPEIARALRYLEDGAIRRQLFMEHVRQAIQVSDNDCRRAFNTAQRTLWIQHAVLDTVEQVRPGYWDPEWTHVQINPTLKTVTSGEFGAFDLVNWNDLDADLEEILFALELGEVSKPLLKAGSYHVFRLVNEESNRMASENQFLLEQEHYRTAITKRREHALAFDFVQTVMQPENLLIRRQTLEAFTQLLWQHHLNRDSLKTQPPGELVLPAGDGTELNALELATFTSGSLSVADFRFIYRMNPLDLSTTSAGQLQKDLVNAIGLYVRDVVFAQQGRAEGLAAVPEVQADYAYWKERLLASRMEDLVYQKVARSDSALVEDASSLAAAELQDLVTTLKQSADISINEALLMGIETSDAGLARKIDFFASHLN